MFLSKKLISFAMIGLVLAGIATYDVQAATPSYGEGSLLRAEDGKTIYYVGPDLKKYVFPESKTYATWYDDFANIINVSLAELDEYEDGGVMPVKGGTRLITHANTAKIYAVEPGGLARHIPSAKIAEELFGEDWYTKVIDVLPGFFASSYKFGEQLAATLPNGYVVAEEGSDDFYYMENGKKRLLSTDAFEANKFKHQNVYRIKNLSKYEDDGEILETKKSLTNFVPFLENVNDKKVLICHYPLGNNENARTLSVSANSIPAHLKNGSTLGECSVDKDDVEELIVEVEEDPETSSDLDDWGVNDLEPGQWCSVLMGMFNSSELGYLNTSTTHAVLDLNEDGVVSLSDLSLMTNMYANGEDGECYDQILSNYDESNYEELDWCGGLVQGITDTYGDEEISSIFDLNDDGVLNLSDVGLVASYKYDADQAACYVEYVPTLPKIMSVDDGDDVDDDIEISDDL